MSHNQTTGLLAAATPVFDLILELRANPAQHAANLRTACESRLDLNLHQSRQYGYDSQVAEAANFALTAFVDEAVLSANFPNRVHWEKNPIQLTRYGINNAGVEFYTRLDELLRSHQADVVEIYYLALLLGFKGKYTFARPGQWEEVVGQVENYLRQLGRLSSVEWSVHGLVSDQPEPPPDPRLPLWVKVGAGAGVALALAVFIALKLFLKAGVNSALESVLR
jgi:type VI secretion system protein ImpK